MEEKPLDKAQALARENFYCPGAWNEEKFAQDFSLFMILRRQCSRYLNSGKLNVPLALNNLIIAMNSFGRHTCLEICSFYFVGDTREVIQSMFLHLGVTEEQFTQPHLPTLELLAREDIRRSAYVPTSIR